MDSGSPVDITSKEHEAQILHSPSVYLQGILNQTTQAQHANVSFPTVSSTGSPIVICTKEKAPFLHNHNFQDFVPCPSIAGGIQGTF